MGVVRRYDAAEILARQVARIKETVPAPEHVIVMHKLAEEHGVENYWNDKPTVIHIQCKRYDMDHYTFSPLMWKFIMRFTQKPGGSYWSQNRMWFFNADDPPTHVTPVGWAFFSDIIAKATLPTNIPVWLAMHELQLEDLGNLLRTTPIAPPRQR